MKLILAGLLLVIAAACGGVQEETVGTATITGSTNVSRDQAIERVTSERCNRELSCGNVGPKRTWETMSGCRDDVRVDTKSYLKADGCGGVDFYDLAVCTDAIRNTQCMSDGLPKLAACDGTKLCR
jgi:hypothetical protein